MRPPKGRIESPIGQPISVEQFLQAVHDYAVPLRKLLLRCMDVNDPSQWDSARFFFDMITNVSGAESPGRPLAEASVNVVGDPTEDGANCAWLWEGIATRVRKVNASNIKNYPVLQIGQVEY